MNVDMTWAAMVLVMVGYWLAFCTGRLWERRASRRCGTLSQDDVREAVERGRAMFRRWEAERAESATAAEDADGLD